MRTTLDIDDDLLLTVGEVARRQEKTIGEVICHLLRESLWPKNLKLRHRNGIPLLPRRPNGPVITLELVNQLRDEDAS